MELDTNKSLSQLLGALTKDTTDSSALATTCLILYEKPLKDFTVENLRVMIGQSIGLEFLIPLAIELLRENPFVKGDYYPGDLLSAVVQAEPGFWQTHEDSYWSVSEIVAGLPSLMRGIIYLTDHGIRATFTAWKRREPYSKPSFTFPIR